VDQEVSKTLGELERKLQELERTLISIDRGGGGEPSVDSPSAAVAPQTPDPSPQSANPTRLVDEAVEPIAHVEQTPSPPVRQTQRPAPPTTPPQAKTPSAEELLRFRDRLERSAQEMTPE